MKRAEFAPVRSGSIKEVQAAAFNVFLVALG